MAPPAPRPAVAVVGGGISGLVAGAQLSAAGLDVTVYDTGEHACGGRVSSRVVPSDSVGGSWDFDHSTQYFTCTPGSRFERLVEGWQARGLVGQWPQGCVGILKSGSDFQPFSDGVARYIGIGGFRPLSDALAQDSTRVVRPQWVGAMRPNGRRWELSKGVGSRTLGTYDFVAISHNGKCAARLAGTAKAPEGGGSAAPKVLASLQCAFGVRPLDTLRRERRLILSSIWAVMFVVPEPLGLQWEGAHIVDSPTVSWASNITAKRQHHSAAASGLPQEECWVLHSTPQYAKSNKVPQENIPASKAEDVTAALLRALEEAAGLPKGSIKPVFTKVQLWGAGNPLTVAGVPAVFDAQTATGACGDWCEGPPCVEAAAISGLALADAVEDLLLPGGSSTCPGASAALDALQVSWQPASSAASPLGGFPGAPDVPLGNLPEHDDPPGQGGQGRGRGRGRAGGRGRGRQGRGGVSSQGHPESAAMTTPRPRSGRGGAAPDGAPPLQRPQARRPGKVQARASAVHLTNNMHREPLNAARIV